MKLDHVLAIFDSRHDHPYSPARRSFLLGSLGILALAPFEYARAAMSSPEPQSSLEELLGALRTEKYVREIGQVFMASEAGRAFDHRQSLERFARDLRQQATVSMQLTQLISSDFLHGNTVRLQGWILARTEVELCALCVN